jgi:hypothetical protein
VKSAFIITDLEGTAGVTSFTNQTRPDARYLDRSRRLVIGVNTAGTAARSSFRTSSAACLRMPVILSPLR